MDQQLSVATPGPQQALLRELADLDSLLRRKARTAITLAADLEQVRATSAAQRRRPPMTKREFDSFTEELRRMQVHIAERRTRRQEIAASVAPDLLHLYEVAAARGQSRPIVALLGARACGGCFLRIEPRLASAMRTRGFIACSHCGRIVFAGDTTPAI